MNFSISHKPIDKLSTQALVVFLPQDKITAEEKSLDKILNGQISALRKSEDFSGEATKTRLIFNVPNLSRVLLVGMGKAPSLTLEKFRESVSVAAQALKSLPVQKISVILPRLPRVDSRLAAQAFSEALILSAYEFPYYKTGQKPKPKFENVEVVTAKEEQKNVNRGLATGRIIANAVTATRDLGNHPANYATPEHLAKHARGLAREYPPVKVKILNRPEIEKEKMGAFLAVAKGSDEEPKFIILEYSGKKTARPIVLVGKGITFDSGGISLKPGEKMDEMKFDMAGAATVMNTIRTAAELHLPMNLVGLVPATENLPSGKASKPGDIVTSRSGQTIEIVNTDAEGRLVLADALDYAKKYKPKLVIDFATLTGSIVVALGDDLIGAFSNNKPYLDQLLAAAKTTGEKTWPMPLEKDYEQFIKSDFADLRNQSTIKYGDAIHAANFLSHFIDYPWIHLDIAGVAWATREKPYRPKGATGTGLRLAIEFLKKFKK